MLIIGFSTARKKFAPFGLAIRLIEQTPYNHVYLKFWSDSLSRWLIYQASHTRLNFCGEQRFLEDEVIIEEFAINTTKEQQTAILQYCIDTVGTPYGIVEIMGLVYARLLGRFGKKIRNPLADNQKTMICSELVGNVLNILGENIPASVLEVEGPHYIHDRVAELVKKQGTV